MPSVGGTNLLAATLRTPSIEVVDVQKNKRSEGLSPPFCPVTRSPNLPQQDLSPSSVLPSTVPGVVHFAPDHALPASLGPAVLSALDAWIGFLGHICVGKLACYLHAWHPPPLVLVWLVFHSVSNLDWTAPRAQSRYRLTVALARAAAVSSCDSGILPESSRREAGVEHIDKYLADDIRRMRSKMLWLWGHSLSYSWPVLTFLYTTNRNDFESICNIVVYLAAFACGRKQRRNPPGSTTPSARFFIPAPLLPEFEIGSEKTHRRQQNHEE
ncbi:hypothetical protein B0H14DRAFT_3159508 [Mycena olivaceomarginata]|nr:hypothetical protein B0H14DRAFT_3159508 [Mycena olivaceomarginata]